MKMNRVFLKLSGEALAGPKMCIRDRMDTRLIPPGHGCRTGSRRPGQSAVRGQEGRLAWHP